MPGWSTRSVPPPSSIWRGLPISAEAEPGTLLRNGHTLRRFNLELADHVEQAAAQGQFPLVVGGDCAVLLGALAGLRRQARFRSSMSTDTAISAIREITTPGP